MLIKAASIKSRIQAFVIDLIFIILFSETLHLRGAYKIFEIDASSFSSRGYLYSLVLVFLYFIPLRFFGQSLGMKLKKIKILKSEDLEFLGFTQIMQRQTIGLIFSTTIGVKTLLKDQKLMADILFKSIVFYVQKSSPKDSSETTL